MKNAQDAVREIKEWPELKFNYLVEHEDGSIGFVDYVPPVVVCSREEFMATKSGKPSWDEAPEWAEWLGQTSSGSWEFYESKPTMGSHHWEHKGLGNGVHVRSGPIIGDWRETLERKPESRRQGYVEGFEGHPDDCAFKGDYRPSCQDVCMGWYDDGRECWHRVMVMSNHPDVDDFMACMILGGEHANKLIWTDSFRPLKSDRDRWKEAASTYITMIDSAEDVAGRIYDALISGELPTPEAK